MIANQNTRYEQTTRSFFGDPILSSGLVCFRLSQIQLSELPSSGKHIKGRTKIFQGQGKVRENLLYCQNQGILVLVNSSQDFVHRIP